MMKSARQNSGGAVLIVTPIREDAQRAAHFLAGAGMAAKICGRLAEAAAEIGPGASALLIAEEALVAVELPILLKALQEQAPWSDLPVIILTGSGGGHQMSQHAVEIFGPAGNITVLERPLQDVTLISVMKVALRARQRQHEMRELIERGERVLASISDAFSSFDHNWRYTYLNDRVAEMAGLPKEKMLGRNVWEIFPGAIGGEFHDHTHEAMRERKVVQGEFFYKPWKRWLDTRIYPAKDGIVVFSADVTERKEQEILARDHGLKLKESEDLLRLATEAADIGTFDYYPLTGELRFSARCKELFGLPPGAPVTYETYLNAVRPEDRRIVHETVRGVSQPGRRGRYDSEYRAVGVIDGKERWLAEKGRALPDESGRAVRFIGTILDITEHKNAEIS